MEGELIAPTGRHAEPGTHAARFGFIPRLRFSEMLGAVDAAGHVTGERRDMMAIRGSVMEILATARRVARGGQKKDERRRQERLLITRSCVQVLTSCCPVYDQNRRNR